MKKYFIILLALCSTVLIVISCKSRCTRGEEKAFDMPKDSRLIGMWRRLNIFPGQDEYLLLQADGVEKSGITKDSLYYGSIWYTIDNYFYTYNCNKSDEMTEKEKYIIKDDTLKILMLHGYEYKYRYYVRVKE